jgi:hypothetical protein
MFWPLYNMRPSYDTHLGEPIQISINTVPKTNKNSIIYLSTFKILTLSLLEQT